MPDQATIDAAKTLLDICTKKKLTLATAESCTGGLVAATISEIAGSSLVLDCGFVTYSNSAKQQMLGVTPTTIDVYGAVSTECAEEMAKGALRRSGGTLAVAVTGIAGPSGGSDAKPVGTVCFAFATSRRISSETRHFKGNRESVRRQSVVRALEGLLETLTRA